MATGKRDPEGDSSAEQERDSRITRRFLDFIDEVGAELGHTHGWKRAVARKLDVSPEHLSRLLSGGRAPSLALLRRAAEVYNFSDFYFFDDTNYLPPRSYRDYLNYEFGSQESPQVALEQLRNAARSVLAGLGAPGGPKVTAADAHELARRVLGLRLVTAAEELVAMRAHDPQLLTRAAEVGILVIEALGSAAAQTRDSD